MKLTMATNENYTKEEEIAIMDMYHNATTQEEKNMAATLMIERLEKFIYSQCSHITNPNTKEDLMQEGREAIFRNIWKFNPSMGRATTFFAPYIKHAIGNYLAGNENGITNHYQTMIEKINKAKDYLEKIGIEPTIPNISSYTDLSEKCIKKALEMDNAKNKKYAENDSEFDAMVNNSKQFASPEEEFIKQQEMEILYNAIEKLTEAEKIVISAKFGLFTNPMKNVDIYKKYGISPEKIRALQNSALKKLKNNISLKTQFKDYYKDSEKILESLDVQITIPLNTVKNVEISILETEEFSELNLL